MKRRTYHPRYVKAARDRWGLQFDRFAVLADGTVYLVRSNGWLKVQNRGLAERVRGALR